MESTRTVSSKKREVAKKGCLWRMASKKEIGKGKFWTPGLKKQGKRGKKGNVRNDFPKVREREARRSGKQCKRVFLWRRGVTSKTKVYTARFLNKEGQHIPLHGQRSQRKKKRGP